jgi:hypothetical protein
MFHLPQILEEEMQIDNGVAISGFSCSGSNGSAATNGRQQQQ